MAIGWKYSPWASLDLMGITRQPQSIEQSSRLGNAMKPCTQPSSLLVLLALFFACSCAPRESNESATRDPQGGEVSDTATAVEATQSRSARAEQTSQGETQSSLGEMGVPRYPGAEIDRSGRLTYQHQDHDPRDDGYGFWVFRVNAPFEKVFAFYKSSLRDARVYEFNISGAPTGVVMKMEDGLLKLIQIQREASETLFSISMSATPSANRAPGGEHPCTGKDPDC